jgi:iron complex outermembrane receptor protein
MLVVPAHAESELSEADFLAEMPTVLTASRLSQPLMDAPNSTNVIDRKQIEASGYRNLADLFRLVPGMYVGHKKGWFHNVTHTFTDEYARRMQVMVDGRSVYLPSIGGVRWDTLPLAVEDIERIEVVRGPNAASFGANAFTGIINIITRHPDDVAGRMLHLGVGDHGQREAWFRWAGRSQRSSHRVTLGERRDDGMTYQYDDETSKILSYRGEFDLGNYQNLGLQLGTVTGDRGEGNIRAIDNQPHEQDVVSGFFQMDYRLDLAAGRNLQAKLFFNHLNTEEINGVSLIPGSYYKTDVLAQRWHGEVQLDSVHDAHLRSAVGAYLRRDSVRSLLFWNSPDKLEVDSHGVFGHLEWRPAETWLMNVGAFWEDYELVGGRFSPRVTLHWQPSPRHAFRLGASKAYRNPVLFETNADRRIRLLAADGSLIMQMPPLIRSTGGLLPETIVSRELGYLGQWPEQDITLDLRVFRERVTDYIDLICPTGIASDCKPSVYPLTYQARDWRNVGGSLQQGYEFQVKWNPEPENLLMLNHAYLDIASDLEDKRYSPKHITGLHWMHRLLWEIDLSLSHYWVSSFKAIGQGPISASQRLDARLARHFRIDDMRATLALSWQNLSGSYLEFDNGNPTNLFDRRARLDFQLEF